MSGLDRTVKRLEELLDLKDREIARLEEELGKAEHELECDRRWTEHEQREDDGGLPVPRLEIRWVPTEVRGYSWLIRYDLIYRHFLGHYEAVPLGQTLTTGDDPTSRDSLLPFRDGAYIQHDAATLGLPAFAVAEDRVDTVEPREHAPGESGGGR